MTRKLQIIFELIDIYLNSKGIIKKLARKKLIKELKEYIAIINK